ncbi:hypothetical protein [Roseivirga sp.]|uniref:hypothetical protein n=1 Tax=Roseivirga sp. TaxID=1964215 RepID=UPI003B52AADF
MSLRSLQRKSIANLILADIITAVKFLLNLLFIVLFIVLALELKSMLEIDIFPNYNFPLDEMIRDFF